MSALDLARELVAIPGWEWRPGMRWIAERAAPLETISGRIVEGRRVLADGVYPGAIPDLDDPATLGALLGLVRERWGGLVTVSGPLGSSWPSWDVYGWRAGALGIEATREVLGRGPTEAAALVAALRAAGVRP